jgi:multidrug resistance efflux pump
VVNISRQEVKAGDVLAELESKETQDAVRPAQLNLEAAQISLIRLLKGPIAADIAQADQAVVQAETQLQPAANDLRP